MQRHGRRTVTVLLFGMLTMSAFAYESMYARTDAGKVEIKELPAVKALSAKGDGTDYFSSNGGVFMKLFRYIDKHKIAMTVPVESDVKANRMRFFVGAKDQAKAVADEVVTVLELPARTVLSAGIRGGYSRENYEHGLETIRNWLARHPDWDAVGEPYAVYWNGPYVPGFLKRSEVHQPVMRK